MVNNLEAGVDLLSIFDDEEGSIPDPVSDFALPLCPGPKAGSPGGPLDSAGLASAAESPAGNSEVGRGDSVPDAVLPDDLSFQQYVQKFKDVFLKARPLEEVAVFAGGMQFKDWLDFVIKLLPKDVKVQGEVNFVHQLSQLGPIDKEAYRLTGPTVVEAEFCEVEG